MRTSSRHIALILLPLLAAATLWGMTMGKTGVFPAFADADSPAVPDDTVAVEAAAAQPSPGETSEGNAIGAFSPDALDGPEGFIPTTMSGLQAADPTAGLTFITPPAANPQGTAALQYPLLLPPARNGMNPDLAVHYSSDSRDGWLGDGWDIPLPAITIDTRWGVPRYSDDLETETYLLDGEMLAFADAAGETHLAHRGEPQPRGTDSLRHFYPRREGTFSTIIRHGSSPQDYWWEIIDRRGTHYAYGTTADSRLTGTFTAASGESKEVIAEWRLAEVKEIHGDYIRYHYRTLSEPLADGLTSAALYLNCIECGNASTDDITVKAPPHTVVTFHSGSPKTVRRSSARYGFLTSSHELLDSISVDFLGQRLRSYAFRYREGLFSRQLLDSLVQCDGEGASVAAHAFTYSRGDMPATTPNGSLVVFGSDTVIQGHHDTEASRIQQLAPAGTPSVAPTVLGGNSGWSAGGSAYVGLGTLADRDKPETAGLTVSYGQSRSAGLSTLADMNGDGYPDLVSGQQISYTSSRGVLSGETAAGMKMTTAHINTATGSGGHAVHAHTASPTENGSQLQGGTTRQSQEAAANTGTESQTVKDGKAQDLADQGKNQTDTIGISFSPLNIDGNLDHAVRTYLDINGDGLPDRVSDHGTVSLNLGYSFAPEVRLTAMPTGLESTLSHTATSSAGIDLKASSFAAGITVATTASTEREAYADINGDGLPDKLSRTLLGTEVALNLGSGFAPAVTLQGLGLLDQSQSATASANAAMTFNVRLPFGLRLALTPAIYASASLSRPTAALRDIDGDGLVDMLSSDSEQELRVRRSLVGTANLLTGVSNTLGGSFQIGYSRSAATTDHPGGKWVMTEVTTDDGIHDDGPLLKTRYDYRGGRHDRREREFLGFAEVRTHQLDAEHGDSTSRTLTETYDVSSIYTRGQLLGTLLTDGQGRPYCRTRNTYYIYKVTPAATTGYYKFAAASSLPDTAAAYTPLKYTETVHYEGGTDSIIAEQRWYSYITSGTTARGDLYIQRVCTKGTLAEDGSGTIDYYIQHSYGNYASKHVYSLPYRVRVYDGSTQKLLRHRQATYKSSCPVDVSSSTLYLYTSMSATTNYTTDSHGNVLTATLPPNNANQRQQYTYTYDTVMGMYPVSVTDKFGYTSTVAYDYRFGTDTLRTDINGFSFHTRLDNLGRIVSVSGPMEQADTMSAIRMEYYPHAVIDTGSIVSPAYAITHHLPFRQVSLPSGDLETYIDDIRTVTLVDGFGRVIQVKKDGVVTDASTPDEQNHVLVCSGRTRYDALGRITHSWQPTMAEPATLTIFSPTFDSVTPTITTYDVLDRPLSVTLPDGTATATTYSLSDGLQKSLVTDALDHQAATYADGVGRVMRTERLGGISGTIATRYAYDALGQLSKVTDHEDNVTSYLYNMAGQVTNVSHPASGTSAYFYDRLGNLSSRQTQNIGPSLKVIAYSYDYDRLKSITYPLHPENNVTYTYGMPSDADDAGANHHALGRVMLREDGTGAVEYSYDVLGNVSEEVRTLVVPTQGCSMTFASEYHYDSFGRLLDMSYPHGGSVYYGYNAAGDLDRVKYYSDSGDAIVSHIGYNKFGQRSVLQLADGTTTTYAYSPERQWLTGLSASTSAKNLIGNTYTFDAVGNILSVTGLRQSHQYGYDDLYRLTHAAGTYTQSGGAATYSMEAAYDDLWRITRKKVNLYQHNVIANHATTYVGYDLGYYYQKQTADRHFQLGAVSDVHYHSSSASYDTQHDRHRYNYDDNGNLVYESIARKRADGSFGERTHERRLLWDEDNRLLALSENGYMSNYWYDADGERTMKLHGAGSSVYVNGENAAGVTSHDRYTLYPSPYFTLTDGEQYAMHVYVGGERIMTQTGNVSVYVGGSGVYTAAPKAGSGIKGMSIAYGTKLANQTAAYRNAYLQLGVPVDGEVLDSLPKTQRYYTDSQLPSLDNIPMFSSQPSDASDATESESVEDVWAAADAQDSDGGAMDADALGSGLDFVDETDIEVGIASGSEIGEEPSIPMQSLFLAQGSFQSSDSVYYYHKDHLGSSTLVTNKNGQVVQQLEYLPYGEVFVDKHSTSYWNTPYKFNGKELDEETGLYYYGARYYDPHISLWLSVDPLVGESPSIYGYCYCFNNPVRLVDQDGRFPILPLIIKAGVNAAADWFMQTAMNYYFNPVTEGNLSASAGNINGWQIFRSGCEGLLPSKSVGGRMGHAALSAVGDVVVNYLSDVSGYTLEQALADFTIGFVGDITGGGLGEIVSKYGSKAVARGLSNLGFDDKKIEELITGTGTTWKGKANYSNLKDPSSVGDGKRFTTSQKRAVKETNMKHNRGYLRSDEDGTFLVTPKRGGNNPLQAEVDHIKARTKEGPNSYRNAQILSKEQNLRKSDR